MAEKTLGINNLAPGFQYDVRVRAIFKGQPSEWGPVETIDVFSNTSSGTGDKVPAAPTSAGLVTPTIDSFILNWTAPTLNADGSTLNDMKDYVIEVSDDNFATTIDAVYYMTEHQKPSDLTAVARDRTFEFTFKMNKDLYSGSPKAVLYFRVYARDATNNRSAPLSGTGTNSAPTYGSGSLTATAVVGGANVSWTGGTSNDIVAYTLKYSTSTGFNPAVAGTEAYRGTLTNYSFSGTTGTPYYFRVGVVDIFGQTAWYATEATATPLAPVTYNTPNPPTVFTNAYIGATYRIGWTASTSNAIDIKHYKVDVTANSTTKTYYTTGNFIDIDPQTGKDFGAQWPYTATAVTVQTIGPSGLTSSLLNGSGFTTAPSVPTPTTLTATLGTTGERGIDVTWTAISDPSSIMDTLEVYGGTATAPTTVVYSGRATGFNYPISPTFNGTYYFRSRVKDLFGRYSAYSAEATRAVTTLGATTVGTVTGSLDTADTSNRTGILNVTWTNPSSQNYAGTKLRYRVNGTSNWTIIDVGSATSTLIRNLVPGIAYNLDIIAYDFNGTFGNSGTWTSFANQTVAADTTKPGNPTTPTLTTGATSLMVKWTNPSDADFINGNGRAEIQISTSATFASDISTKTQPGGVAAAVCTESFTGLTPSTTYYARVRVLDAVGNENTSGWIATSPASIAVGSAGNPSDGFVPSGTIPTPTAISGIGGIHVRWTPMANADPLTYEVHAGTTVGFTPSGSTLIGEISGTYFFAKVDGTGTALAYATDYYFKLRPKDVDGSHASYGPVSGAAQVVTVGTTDITNGAVTSTKVSDGAITAAKIGALIGGGNILTNSSFELDANSDGVANDWTTATAGSITATTTISTTEKIDGLNSQRLNMTASAATGYRYLLQSGTMPAGAVTKFTLSFWYKGSRTATGAANMVLGNSGFTSYIDAQFVPTSTWQRGSITWTVPGADTTWRVELRTRAYTIGDTCDLYIDGVQLEVGDVATAYSPKPDEILDGTITAAKITAGTITADRLSLGVNQSFQKAIFDNMTDMSQWNLNSGTAGNLTVQTPSDAILGGSVFRVQNNIIWIGRKDPMPFDPTTLYRLTVKARRTATVGANENVYFGLNGYAADKTTYVNASGVNAYTSQHYGVSAIAIPVSTNWTTYEMFYLGTSGTPTTGSNSQSNPTTYSSTVMNNLHTNVKYIAPLLLMNHNGGAGTIEVGSVVLEAIPPKGIIGTSIADGTINTAQINANAITATQIAAGAITANKLNVIAGGGNIMGNSSFDAVSPTWTAGLPHLWTKGANVTLTQVTGRLGVGSAMRLTTSSAVPANTAVDRTNQNINNKFAASTTYVVSAYVKRNSGTGNLNFAVDGLGTYTLAGTATTPVVSTAWQRFSTTITTTGTAPSGSFAFYPTVQNDVFEIDDFQIEAGDLMTAYTPATDEILPGTIVTSQISASGISADVLTSGTINAGTITVSNINASNISTGTLNADRIATASLAADKILIGGSASNMVPVEFADFEATSTLYNTGQALAPAPTGTSPGTIQSSGSQAKFGTRSLQVDLNATNQGVYLAQSATTYNIPMVSGKKYIVSAYVYTNATQNVTLRYKYSGGGPTNLTMITTSGVLNSWTRVYGTFTAPADGMANISVQFTNTTGTQYIDGVMMEEQLGGATTPGGFLRPSTVIDGASVITGSLAADKITTGTLNAANITVTNLDASGIEAGTVAAGSLAIGGGANMVPAQYAAFEWPISPNNYYTGKLAVSGSATATVVAGNQWNGLNSLKIDTTTATNEVFLGTSSTDYNVPVKSAKTYIISAHIKAASGAPTVKIRAKGNVAGVLTPTPATITTTASYVQYSAVVTTGASDTAMLISFADVNTVGAQTIYVDGVMVEERLGVNAVASSWVPGASTSIDGGGITTNSLDAAALKAGTAIVENLTLGDATDGVLTVSGAGGKIKSSNYVASTSGWQLDQNGLDIQDGTINAANVTVSNIDAGNISTGNLSADRIVAGSISAAKLYLSGDGRNLIPLESASFENATTFYTSKYATTVASYAVAAGNQQFGAQSLGVTWSGTGTGSSLWLAATSTTYNIPVKSSTTYIFSFYAKQAALGNIRAIWKGNVGATLTAISTHTTTASMARYTGTFTTGASDTAVQVGFDSPTSATIMYFDGIMLEEKIGNNSVASTWIAPSATVIDGTGITTNTITADQISATGITAAKLQIGGSGTNLIPEQYRSFENNATGSFWADKFVSTANVTPTITTSSTMFGAQALQLDIVTSVTSQTFTFAPASTYNIEIEPGKTYIVSMYVRTTSAGKTLTMTATGNVSGALAGTGNTGKTVATAAFSATSRISATFLAGASDTRMFIGLSTFSAIGTYYIDGIMVEEKIGNQTTPSSFDSFGGTIIDGTSIATGTVKTDKVNLGLFNSNLLENGSFEKNGYIDRADRRLTAGASAVTIPGWTFARMRGDANSEAYHEWGNSWSESRNLATSPSFEEFNGVIYGDINISTEIITSVAHGLAVNDVVTVRQVAAATGLTYNTPYYIVATSFTADQFRIATTYGGTALTFTTGGAVEFSRGTPNGYSLVTSGTHNGGAHVTTGSAASGNYKFGKTNKVSGWFVSSNDVGLILEESTDLYQNDTIDVTGVSTFADFSGAVKTVTRAAEPVVLNVIDVAWSTVSNNVLLTLEKDHELVSGQPIYLEGFDTETFVQLDGFHTAQTSATKYEVTVTATSTAISCSMTIATDYVTVNNHGLVGGDKVIFKSISGTTGINTTTQYYAYVIDENNFKVQTAYDASGVTFVNLATANGTGTVRLAPEEPYGVKVTADAWNTITYAKTGSNVAYTPLTVPGTLTYGKAARLQLGASTTAGALVGIEQNYQIQAGTVNSLAISFWYKVTGTARLNAYLGDALTMGSAASSLNNTATTWTNVTLAYTPGTSVTTIQMQFDNVAQSATNTGDVYIDGVQLITGTTGNLLAFDNFYSEPARSGLAKAVLRRSATTRSCTFQIAGNTVTINSHGLLNGDLVTFSSITSTTGISINTPYYVVGSATNTFQVALTAGGAAIDLLTLDGTGAIYSTGTKVTSDPFKVTQNEEFAIGVYYYGDKGVGTKQYVEYSAALPFTASTTTTLDLNNRILPNTIDSVAAVSSISSWSAKSSGYARLVVENTIVPPTPGHCATGNLYIEDAWIVKKGSTSGELTDAGIRLFDTDGKETMSIMSDSGDGGDFMKFGSGVEIDGASNSIAASIVNVADEFRLAGQTIEDILRPYPRGIVARMSRSSDSDIDGIAEKAFLELRAEGLSPERLYKVCVSPINVENTNDGGSRTDFRIRYNSTDPSQQPTTSDLEFGTWAVLTNNTVEQTSSPMFEKLLAPSAADVAVGGGTYRFVLTFQGSGTVGANTITIKPNGVGKRVAMWIEDIGPNFPETGAYRNASAVAGAGKIVVKTFNPVWTADYSEYNGGLVGTNHMRQGYRTGYGVQTSAAKFNNVSSTIPTGARIIKAEIYLYAYSSALASGVDTVIGLHKGTTANPPASWSSIPSKSATRITVPMTGGGQWIDVTTLSAQIGGLNTWATASRYTGFTIGYTGMSSESKYVGAYVGESGLPPGSFRPRNTVQPRIRITYQEADN
jgi:hypothetical protein